MQKNYKLSEEALLAVAEAEFFSTIPAKERLYWFEKWFLSDEAEKSGLYLKFQEHMKSEAPMENRPARSSAKPLTTSSRQQIRKASEKPVVVQKVLAKPPPAQKSPKTLKKKFICDFESFPDRFVFAEAQKTPVCQECFKDLP